MQAFPFTRFSEGLPPGWERAFDPKSGRPFYINHNTQETMWELPHNINVSRGSLQGNVAAEGFNEEKLNHEDNDQHFSQERNINIKQPENPFYAPRPYNLYPNIFPQQKDYQTSQENYPPPQFGYTNFFQQLPPQVQFIKPSAPALAESGRASQQRLSTIKPRWNIPFHPDEEACARCQKQYRVLSKGQYCNCCMRKFCSGCTQKKAPVKERGDEVCTVCDSCFRHISRGDMCCIPRLVPYIAEKSSSVRLDALRELLEAAENNDRKFITPDEFLPLSTVPVLKDTLSSKVSREEVEYTAGILAKIIMAGTSSCGKQISLKKCAYGAVEASNKYIDNGQNLSKLLSVLAGTGVGRKALLETHRVFRVLSKGLSGDSPIIVRNCTHALRGLGNGKDDKQDQNTDTESEIPILSSLSAILARDNLDSSIRSDALSSADKFCYREETKIFFCQSNGVPNVIHSLMQGQQAPEANDIKHGAAILYKLAGVKECALVVADNIEGIFGLCLNTKEISAKGSLLQVIAKLASISSTRKAVSDFILSRGCNFAAIFAGSNQAMESYGLRIILCALSMDQLKARSALASPEIINTLRRIATSRGSEAQKAIEALAILDSNSLKNAGGLNEIIDRFSKKEQSAIDALISITGELGTAGYVLENTKFMPALIQLLQSKEAKYIQAGWQIISNLSTITGFGSTLYDSGAFKNIKSILTETPVSLRTSVLRAIGQMCVADNMLTGSLIDEDVAMKITEFCSEPAAEVQYAAIATCAEMIVCYPPFFSMFSRFGGIDIIIGIIPTAQNDAIRERAIFILTCVISITEPQSRHAYVKAIPVLADVLFSGTGQAQVHAASGLRYFGDDLTEDTENFLLDSGSILALVSGMENENEELKKATCCSLSAIAPRSQRCCKIALDSGALSTIINLLRSNEDKLHEPCLKILGCMLREEEAQKEFCSDGGLDLLTELCSHSPSVKEEAMKILMDLSMTEACSNNLLNTSELLALLASKDAHMRYKALRLAANLIKKDTSIAHEIIDKGYISCVLECFSEAPINSPEMHDSLLISSISWKYCGPTALEELTQALTPEQLLPVLASEDPETVTLALTILYLEDVPEDNILPDLSTKEIIQNLCRAVVTETIVRIPKDNMDNEEGDKDESGEGYLELRDDAGPKMALYILFILMKKYQDAVGPHLCQKDTIPYLFTHIGDSDISKDALDFFLGILLSALRQEKELKKVLLKRKHAHKGLEVILTALSTGDNDIQNKGVKILSMLSSTPGNTFSTISEKAKYAQVAKSLVIATKEGSQNTYMLLSTLSVILKNEKTHKEIAGTIDFETMNELISDRDNPGISNLALTVAGTLSGTSIFRDSQGGYAREWAELFCSLLEEQRPNEDSVVRSIVPIVGFAPSSVFREAFTAKKELISRLSAIATNLYIPKAQALAIRSLTILGVHSVGGAILDITISHSHRNACVLSEILRFCTTLNKEELYDMFRTNDKRLTELWDLRKTNITPSSLFSLITVCTTLAENEQIRGRLAQMISPESLKDIGEFYPFAADYATVLKIYLGI